MRPSLFVVAATFALSACATQQDAPVASEPAPASTAAAPPPMGGTCNADAASGFVGQQATDAVVEQARVAAGAAVARALRPDMVITMEYRGDRLNLRTDVDGKVVGASCG